MDIIKKKQIILKLLLMGTVILVVSLITIFMVNNSTKEPGDNYGYLSYDSKSLPIVNGSTVINAIKKYENAPLGIIVETEKSTISYINNIVINETVASFGTASNASLKSAQDPNNMAYINPSAEFDSESLFDENDVIIGLRFTQK